MIMGGLVLGSFTVFTFIGRMAAWQCVLRIWFAEFGFIFVFGLVPTFVSKLSNQITHMQMLVLEELAYLSHLHQQEDESARCQGQSVIQNIQHIIGI
jgi:hypothetical protein